MDQDQRPGSTYTPDSAGENGRPNQQDMQSWEAPNQPDAASQPAAANEEIAAIDDAVQNAPQQPDQSPQQHQVAHQVQQSAQTMPESTSQEPQTTQMEPPQQSTTPESQPERSTPAANQEPLTTENTQSDSDAPLLTWQAAEPTEANAHNMRSMLGIVMIAIAVSAAVIILNGVNFSTIMSIVVVVLAVIAVVVSSRQHNHLENYAIYNDGIAIGDRFYDFSQMRAFSIVSFGNAASVELEPTQRFMVRRVMHLDNGTAQQAIELLGQYIPYEERTDGVVDQINTKLKL